MSDNMSTPKVVIIGAGLQGASLAFAIASRGVKVEVLERNAQPMSGTVLRNEGKIHLGFIYALDDTGHSQRSMLEGALNFGRLLETWCGPIDWSEMRSAGFRYAVMPDSIASAGRLEEAYERLRADLSLAKQANKNRAEYLGEPLSWLWRKCGEGRGGPRVADCRLFETEEVSLDTRILCKLFSEKLIQHSLIDVRCGATVIEAQRRPNGFILLVQDEGGVTEVQADIVLNCAWENRALLDRTVGAVVSSNQENFRIKHQILVRPKDTGDIYPVTMVQGPYGDIVPLPDGIVYISWYPLGRTYFGSLPPPKSELEDSERAMRVAECSLEVLAGLFPPLENAEIISSCPGIIIAKAKTDVDDLGSGLHFRTSFGAQHDNGWWSVNPGKLTTAPIIAERTAKELQKEW